MLQIKVGKSSNVKNEQNQAGGMLNQPQHDERGGVTSFKEKKSESKETTGTRARFSKQKPKEQCSFGDSKHALVFGANTLGSGC
jgi:hypothetical protein